MELDTCLIKSAFKTIVTDAGISSLSILLPNMPPVVVLLALCGYACSVSQSKSASARAGEHRCSLTFIEDDNLSLRRGDQILLICTQEVLSAKRV